MSDHPKQDLHIHLLGEQDGNSMPSVYGRIQTQCSSSIKFKFKQLPKNSDDIVAPNGDSRPQNKPLRNGKRKANEMESTTCEECGKSFPSLKSKHGHMRCHSGKFTPRKSRLSTQSPALSVTDRRHPIQAISDEDLIAADILMQISRGNFYFNGNQATNNRMYINDAENIMIEMNSKRAEDFAKTNQSCSSNMYQCNICKRFFSSYQALGGHTASHNKKNISGEKGIMEVEGTGAEPMRSDDWVDSGYIMMNKKASGDHVCNICGSIFSSGQALGGHKRLHWIPRNNQPASTSNLQTETSLESAEIAIGQVTHFDLNEIPMDEGFSN